ncbi:MAG: hypothetical protein M3T96_03765 [Acidobacteriota bacterium]|nr:hypothetical protein [Acidobacteriota bacterium]
MKNLKTSDRFSALLVGLTAAFFPFVFWQPFLLILIAVLLVLILFLNRRIFRFFADRKGLLFAAAFPWQLFYFFYSGATFVFCWFRYALPPILGLRKPAVTRRIQPIN